jgi:hypothetical protein
MENNGMLLPVSKEGRLKYLERLPDRIYKILPIAEEKGRVESNKYLFKFLNELIAFDEVFDNALIELIAKMNVAYFKEDLEFVDFRKLIFDSITLAKEIKLRLENDE